MKERARTRSMRSLVLAMSLAAVAMACVASPLVAQTAAPLFSTEQAQRGEEAYAHSCAQCHGAGLDDGEFGGAPLNGSYFAGHWGSGDARALFDFATTTMPPDNPGSLTSETYADIIAFLLQQNGYAAGRDELPADPARLQTLTLKN
jgi:mono/diheme cytochrome c family protein